MELSEILLSDDRLKQINHRGEIIPDPNLIRNIDHLASFVQMELEIWIVHSNKLNSELQNLITPMDALTLLETKNIRFYLKSLFDVATYYIACVQATNKLVNQLYNLSSKYYKLKVKKPKLELDKIFHNKAQFIRDKSFIHQDSEQIKNPMDKKTAMCWTPNLSHKIGVKPNCESYRFADGKWWVEVNRVKKETEIDISISGLVDFVSTAIEQIEIRKRRIINYYNEIKHNKAKQLDA